MFPRRIRASKPPPTSDPSRLDRRSRPRLVALETRILLTGATASITSETITPSASTFGQGVSLTAFVRSGAPTGAGQPTGTMEFDGIARDGAAPVRLGVATVLASGLAVLDDYAGTPTGIDAIEANYLGDATFAPSSAAVAVTVASDGAAQVTLSASNAGSIPAAASVAPGQAVTFAATVVEAPADAPVTLGSPLVSFYDGSTLLGREPIAAFGPNDAVASITTTLPGVSSHLITAQATYLNTETGQSIGITSRTITETEVPAATTTSVTVAPATTAYGQPFTITVAVARTAPGAGVPTGTVAFAEPGNFDGLATLVDGVATLPVPGGLVAGPHSILVTYEGDADDAASSAVANFAITAAATKTTVTAAAVAPQPGQDAQAPEYGQAIELTARVAATTSSTLIPTGSVVFIVGKTTEAPTPLINGVATLLIPAGLVVGSYTINATYSGDANDATGTATTTATIALAPTAVQVATAATTVYGQPETITATVAATTSSTLIPTGSVVFTVGKTTEAPTPLINGVATLLIPGGSAVGSPVITAAYSGDANDATGTATTTTSVTPVGTTATLGPVAPSSPYGQTITLTATVVQDAPGTLKPSGLVVFTVDKTTTAVALDAAGQATLTIVRPTAGSHTVSAAYQATTDFLGSVTPGPPLGFVVLAAPTTTQIITTLPASIPLGTDLAIIARVQPESSSLGVPTGVVTWYDGQALIATTPLDSNGEATIATTLLGVGSHAITARYAAQGNDAASQSSPAATTVVQPVVVPTPTVTLGPILPTQYGQGVPLTATVTVTVAGSTTPITAGSVTFTVDGSPQPSVSLVQGAATCTVPGGLAVGSHPVTATYTAPDGTQVVTAPQIALVTAAPTTVTLGPVANSVYGQPEALTARVAATTSATLLPTGFVTFAIDGVLQPAVRLQGGVATWPVPLLLAGSHAVTATYSGDPNDQPDPIPTPRTTWIERPAATSTTLTASTSFPTSRQPVTLTATVQAEVASGAAPAGSVTFLLDGVPIGTATLASGGTAVLSGLYLPVGEHVAKAVYSGVVGEFGASVATTLGAPVITRIAGTTGVAGFSGDGGPAKAATFNTPTGLAVDNQGRLLVADTVNDRIRLITNPTGPSPMVTTLVGAGMVAAGAGAVAAPLATLSTPAAVAADAAGDVFIADTGNNRVLVLNQTTGQISVLAGPGATAAAAQLTLDQPQGLAVNPAGTTLYIADTGANRIIQLSLASSAGLPTATTVAVLSAVLARPAGLASNDAIPPLNAPTGLTLDAAGNLLIADTGNNLVRRYTPSTRTLNIIAGSPSGVATPNGNRAIGTVLDRPVGVVVDSLGRIDFLDAGDDSFRSVSPGGSIVTIPTQLGAGLALNAPQGIALLPDGSFAVSNTDEQTVETVSFSPTSLASWTDGIPVIVSPSVDTPGETDLAASALLVPISNGSVGLVGLIALTVSSEAEIEAEVSSATGAPNQASRSDVVPTSIDEDGETATTPDDGLPADNPLDRAAGASLDPDVFDALSNSARSGAASFRQAFGAPPGVAPPAQAAPAPAPPAAPAPAPGPQSALPQAPTFDPAAASRGAIVPRIGTPAPLPGYPVVVGLAIAALTHDRPVDRFQRRKRL